MAELSQGRVDIISREDGSLISQIDGLSSRSVVLDQPSVVRINGTRDRVVHYERQGNDLVLHMRDGSTVRYQRFFFEDENGEHSELVFDDGVHPAEHALFPTAAGVSDSAAVAVTPGFESLPNVEPLLLAGADEFSTGVIAASGLGILGLAGIAIGASNGGGGDGGGNADNGDNGGGSPPAPPVTGLPGLRLNPFAGDNLLDSGEKSRAQTLSGTAINVEAGQVVSVTLNGKLYRGIVDAEGNWSVSIPASDLAALAAGKATFNVSVSNAAGQSTSATLDFSVQPAPEPGEPAAPTISIASFTGDNRLDNNEKNSPQTLAGTTTGVEAGQIVTVTLNGASYRGTVAADGSWRVSIPASDLAALAAGNATFSVSVSNAAGQSASATLDFSVQPPAGEVTITEPLSVDGYLNADEARSDLHITGSTTGVALGARVILTFNGETYSGTVDARGNWSVTIPASDFSGIRDGRQTLSVTVTDSNGNTLSADATLTVVVNNLPQVSLDESAFSDGVLTFNEANGTQILSGNSGVTGEGQIVRVNLNGQIYSAHVNNDGSWSLSLPASALQGLGQGNNRLTVTVSDAAGNSSSTPLTFDVDTVRPALNLNTPAGDGIINQQELSEPLVLSGSSEGSAAITVSFNGVTYNTMADEEGNWTLRVPAEDLARLDDGGYALIVSATDRAGNTTTTQSDLVVKASPASQPTLTLNSFAGNDIVDGAERLTDQQLSGSTTSVEPGQRVTVTLNGQSYTAEVQASGSWSLMIPAEDLQRLPEGPATIVVAVSDVAGNATREELHFEVNSMASGLSLDTISGDNALNAGEISQPLIVTGASFNVPEGTTVTLLFNNQTYTGQVGADGRWRVIVPETALASLPDGVIPLSVSAADAAGNSVSGTGTLNVLVNTLPTAEITSAFGDGVLNAQEISVAQMLSGSTGVRGDGQSVSLTLDGNTYSGTVDVNGNWRLEVPPSALANLAEGSSSFTLTVSDAAGNSSSVAGSVTVDTTPPVLTLNAITGDDIINIAESGAPVVLSGTTDAAAGQVVTVRLNDKQWTTTVSADGNWTLELPAGALADINPGAYQLTATVTDEAGNATTESRNITIAFNTLNPTLNTPFGDGYLGIDEAATAQTLSGSTGLSGAGQRVLVTLNGKDYSATVDNEGRWTLELDAGTLQGLPTGNSTILVRATDAAGNAGSVSSTINIDFTPPVLSIAPVAGDNIINALEINQGMIVRGIAQTGDQGQPVVVTITFNGETYTTQVLNDNSWSVNIPASVMQGLTDGTYPIRVSLTDAAGNVTTETQTITRVADSASLPTLTLAPVSGDNYLNQAEAGTDLVIRGSSSQLAVNQPVTLTLNGETYTGRVDANGNWSVTVPASALSRLADGEQVVMITATDAAGNPASASTTFVVVASPEAQPLLNLDVIAGNGVLNASEAGQPLQISGSSQLLLPDTPVTVTLSGVDYSATIDASGNWTVTIPAANLADLPQGSNSIRVTARDEAGNPATSTADFTVNTVQPALGAINLSAGSDLSQADALAGLTVSGTSEAGAVVTVTLNGVGYTTRVGEDNLWSLTIPPADLRQLPDGPQSVQVVVSDADGNTASDSVDLNVVINNLPTLTVDPPFGDGLLSAAEAGVVQTLSGTAFGLAAGTRVTVTLGDREYTGTVAEDNRWHVEIPAGELATLEEGITPVIVSASDAAGNPAQGHASVEVLLTAPTTPVIATAFGDNIINAVEAATTQLITGTVTVSEGQTLTVKVDGIALAVTSGSDGSWTASLTPAQIATLGNGTHTISVIVTDRAGNSSREVTQDFTVATAPISAPTLDTPFGDGILNRAEAEAGGLLRGQLGAADAVSVTVTVNGTVYTAEVNQSTGSWSLALPPSLLLTLPDGTWPTVITVTDSAGNSQSLSQSLQVAINNPPDVTLNLPFGNGALNAEEAATAQTLSGSTGISGAGQSVNVVISGLNGDQPYTATVDINGNWTLTLEPTDLATLANGTHTITVTATDAAGNSDEASLAVITGVQPVVVTFDATASLGSDGLLGLTEAASGVTLTGTTGFTGENQAASVTVDLNGTRYLGNVDAQGNWTIEIPAGALNAIGSGPHTFDVTITDPAGNTRTTSFDFEARLTAPAPALDAPFVDGYLNAEAIADGVTLTGSTGLSGTGQRVQVNLNNQNYEATVNTEGSWTLNLTPAQLADISDGTYSLTVTARDAAGNVGTISSTINVDTRAPIVSDIIFAGDNVLQYSEGLVTQILSGTANGAEPGATVTVDFNGQTLNGIVGADGAWSIRVTPAQMAQLPSSGSVTISVTVTDLAGNTSATVSQNVSLDLTPPPGPRVTLNPVSDDNIINASDTTVFISGSAAGVGANATITLTLAGQTYSTTTDGDGNWRVEVDASTLSDGAQTVNVSASGADGTATRSETLTIDRTLPVLTLDPFTGDNIVNVAESQTSQTVTGTAAPEDAGRSVSVSLNGKIYNAIVQADGSWSATIPAADMQALADGGRYSLSARMTDAAGNTGEAPAQEIMVKSSAPLINVDAVLGDNLLNAAEIAAGTLLTGQARGAEGQTITLYGGDGQPLATALVQENGQFSFDLSPEVLGGLTSGRLVFGLRVTDEAGNQTDATVTINKIVNDALNLVVDSVFGDGFLNATDVLVGQTVSGIAEGAGAGSTLRLSLGDYTQTVSVGQDGRWAVLVPPSVLGLLTDGNYDISLTLSDVAGNEKTLTVPVTAIVQNLPVIGDLNGLFGGDNLLNIAEANAGQTLSGVINAVEGSQVTVILGSQTYTTRVTAGGNWRLELPASDLTNLLNGDLTLEVRVVDPAGNTAAESVVVGIFTAQPSVSLTSLFGDGILNLADIATGQIISGVVNNVAAGSRVTLTIGNNTINATVGQDGTFSATVSPDILGTLAQGNLTIVASVTDAAGNSASTSAGIRVDTLLPTITLNPLFGDGLLNAADALVTQVVGGVVSGAEPGSQVVVSLAGRELVTTTDNDGSFSVALTPALLQGLPDGNLTVGVRVTDSAGNTASSEAGALVGIHNLPRITLNPLFGDGVLNLAESLVTQTISGTIANVVAGTAVRINIGNTTLNARTDENGAFSTQVTPDILGTLLNGNLTVGVSVTDGVGNTSSITSGIQLGVANQPTLTLNPLFGDGVLSAADLASNQLISGSSTNLAAGTTVSATLNGVTYSGQVGSGGNWSISVPQASLAAIADGTQRVTVTASDVYGNPATISGTLSVISHTPPAVTITSLFGDNALSVNDVRTAQTISGTTTNAEGATVRVSIGNQTFTTPVNSSGAWSLVVPATSLAAIADGSYTVTASVTNSAGVSGSGSANLNVVSHTTPTVTLNSFFGGDGYLNIAEASTSEVLSGRSTNAAGGTVTVNLEGRLYTTAIDSNGNWSVTLPASSLKTLSDGSHSLQVTVKDLGGNTATTSTTFTALAQNTPLIGVDPVLNVATSLLFGLAVTGGTLNAAQGATVKITLLLANGAAGPTVTTTTDALGRYSAFFSPSLLSVSGLLLSLSTGVRAQVIDAAGNSSTVVTTLLLGSLLTLAGESNVATLSADEASLAVAADHSLSTTSLSPEEETPATKLAATTASTLTTSAEGVSSAVLADSGHHSDTPPVEDVASDTQTDAQSYTIGGLVIRLADGSVTEGAAVTGSSGADIVMVNDIHFTHIDGGAGSDTLVLNGENMMLDLTALGLKVENIEIVDLGESGTNAVKLDLNEALNMTDSQSDDLVIRGADGSQVMLSNSSGGVWENSGQRALDGQTYDVYHNTTLAADNTLGDVLVQHNLRVTVI